MKPLKELPKKVIPLDLSLKKKMSVEEWSYAHSKWSWATRVIMKKIEGG